MGNALATEQMSKPRARRLTKARLDTGQFSLRRCRGSLAADKSTVEEESVAVFDPVAVPAFVARRRGLRKRRKRKTPIDTWKRFVLLTPRFSEVFSPS